MHARKILMWVLVGWLLSIVISPRAIMGMVRGQS